MSGGGAFASSVSSSSLPGDQAPACPAPPSGYGRCGAVQLLHPAQNWHPTAKPGAPSKAPGGGSSSVSPPSSGYYPIDLQSAYGLASAISSAAKKGPGASAPTVAIVDAYDDPTAASDLATYRSVLSGAKDPNTGLTDGAIPPLCSSPSQGGCVTFTKVNQSGGTSYPRADKGWAEEISLDLDMVSSVCPDCNITLVEASSSSFSNLKAAVRYAKSLAPAVVTNSYGGSEFSSETSYNSVYANSTSTAVTAATGDSGYGVEYPAAAPGVTAVGGTSLTYSGGGSGLTWNPQTVWSGTGAGCSAYETQPSWQGAYSSALCTERQVGDVAAVADPSTGVAVYDTDHETGWLVFGGTSASTQIVGGIYGLAAFAGSEQSSAGALYASASGNLVPVTAGSDGSCGNYLCNAADSLSGYNGPTGLGTPDGIGAFTGASPAPSFTVAATPSTDSVATTKTASYTVTVNPSGGFTGNVALTAAGCPSDTTCSFSVNPVGIAGSGSVSSTLTVPTTANDAGTYHITVTGTSGSLSSSTTVTLTVSSSSSSSGTMHVSVAAGQVTQRGPNYHVPLTVTASDASSNLPLSGAAVTLDVYAGTSCSGTVLASGTGTTGSAGQVSFTYTTRSSGSWCAAADVSDAGYSAGTGSTTFTTP